jgi:LEA14-like dessication related protein
MIMQNHNNHIGIGLKAAPLLILWLLATVLSGCATLGQFMQKPSMTFKQMTIGAADLVQATAVFTFDITNPNPIGLRIDRITYDLKLNGRNFVNGQLDQGVMLRAGGTSALQVPVTMPYLDFFKTADQLWRTRQADYALTGEIQLGLFKIPFQAHGRLDLPRMPKISLESIRIREFSLLGATLDGRLQIENPNAFDIMFKRLDYNLNLNGTSFARTSAVPAGPVGPHGRSIIDLVFEVSFARLGLSAYQLLQGAQAGFSLDGGVVFERPAGTEHNAPFALSGVVPLIH